MTDYAHAAHVRGSRLEYRTGDALDAPERPVIFAHVVNNIGRWGAGFTAALDRSLPWAARSFQQWASRVYLDAALGAGGAHQYELGRVHVRGVGVGVPQVCVAHLCAQRGLRGPRNPHPLSYPHLRQALVALNEYARTWAPQHAIVMPRIGCGLAGGRWGDVEPLVEELLSDCSRVIVYTLDST